MAGSSSKSCVSVTTFSGEGFLNWSKTMKRRLVSEGLWFCVERMGEVDDAKALSLINQSLSPTIYIRIRNATTAKEAWDALHFMFLPAHTKMDENADESCGENVKSCCGPCEEDGVMLLSGNKPFFDMLLTKSALKPTCQMNFPSKVDYVLPSSNMVAKVRFFGKIYEIYFYGQRKPKSFGAGWRVVLDEHEHEMLEGHFLIFEIMESSDTKLEINMQILRPRIPPHMEQEMTKRGINVHGCFTSLQFLLI